MNTKKFFPISLTFILLIVSCLNTYALNEAKPQYLLDTEEVPGKMNAGTIIKYDENLNMIIINQGSPNKVVNTIPDEAVNLSKMSAKEQEEYLLQLKLLEEAKKSAKELPVTNVILKPEPNMIVCYDMEGFVREVFYAEDTLNLYLYITNKKTKQFDADILPVAILKESHPLKEIETINFLIRSINYQLLYD